MGRSKTLLRGAVAGSATALVIQPFDVVKTFYLTGQDSMSIRQGAAYVFRRYGVLGYWKGMQAALIRAVMGGGTMFFTLEFFTSLLQTYTNFYTNVLASAIARGCCTVMLCPLSIIKIRMEAPQQEIYSNFFHGVRSIYLEEGFRGYYKGVTANLFRDLPFSGLAYGFYRYYSQLMGEGSLNTLFAAGFGGFTATILTQPFDVLKTRLQFAHVDSDRLHEYRGIFDGVRNIWKSEGFKGFTRGLTIRLVEKSVSYGLIWGVYEKLKSKL